MERFLLSLLLTSLSGSAGIGCVCLFARCKAALVPPKWLRAACIVLLVGLLMPVRPALPRSVPAPVVRMETVRPERLSAQSASQSLSAEQIVGPVAPARQISSVSFAWPPVVFSLWAAGALCTLFVQISRHVRFLRMVRRWGEKDASASLKTGVRAYRCAFVSSTFCAGVFRPILILPAQGEPNEHILRHETAHLRQKDLWLRALVVLAGAMHWFNPAMRLLEAELTAACEMRADELCMQGCDLPVRKAYAETVLHTTYAHAAAAPLAMQFSGGKNTMKRRIQGILMGNMGRFGALALLTALICVALAPSVVAENDLLGEYMGEDGFVPPMGLTWESTTDEIREAIDTGDESVGRYVAVNGVTAGLENRDVLYPWSGTVLSYKPVYWVQPETQQLQRFSLMAEFNVKEIAQADIAAIDALVQDIHAQLSACCAVYAYNAPENMPEEISIAWAQENGMVNVYYVLSEDFYASLALRSKPDKYNPQVADSALLVHFGQLDEESDLSADILAALRGLRD